MAGASGYFLALNKNQYKKYNTATSSWQTITSITPTEENYLQGNTLEEVSQIPESAWQELTRTVELFYYTDDMSKEEVEFQIETEPFTLADEFANDSEIKIIEYTDNPSQAESAVTIETEPFSFYDEMGDSFDVLYYTDDPAKTSAELEINANYSPLDEIDGDFEVVTWTDEEMTDESQVSRKLLMNALPTPQFVTMANPKTINGSLKKLIPLEVDPPLKNSDVRYLISANKTQWKTWNGTSFVNIDIHNMDNIVTNGMTLEMIKNITEEQWKSWGNQNFYIGIYLEDNIRDQKISQIDSLSYVDAAAMETTKISDAKLYILNTISTIDVKFTGSTITGTISDVDKGKVQYRVLLNNKAYFPSDGSFTPLLPSPLDISLTFTNSDIKIDQNNVLRIEFQDYWGATDYWESNFVGTYNGLLFLDETGNYYSTEIGQVLNYLDFGVIIAGQTTLEQAIVLRNTYGYTIENIHIKANQFNFPEGMKAQFGTNINNFEALDELYLPFQLADGEETTFYLRLSTQLGITPKSNGEFDISVTADRVG